MFREVLKDIVEKVEGSVGALVMGLDGISIDSYTREDKAIDIQPVGIEITTIVKEIRNISEMFSFGSFEEFTFSFSGFIVLFRIIKNDYFAMLIVEGDGNFGKARFYLRRACYTLESEL